MVLKAKFIIKRALPGWLKLTKARSEDNLVGKVGNVGNVGYKLWRKTHTLAYGMKAAFSIKNYISTT